MARGNQRDKAREANLKKQAAQKSKNNMSGAEMQRAKESAAEIMRKKQLACKCGLRPSPLIKRVKRWPRRNVATGADGSSGGKEEGRGRQEEMSKHASKYVQKCELAGRRRATTT